MCEGTDVKKKQKTKKPKGEPAFYLPSPHWGWGERERHSRKLCFKKKNLCWTGSPE
jgi:hypothetical protein